MKFQKDKKYEWMSATAPFEVELASDVEYYDIHQDTLEKSIDKNNCYLHNMLPIFLAISKV